MVAPSSNPRDIYRDLKDACERNDKHNPKILSQKTSLKSRAVLSETDGVISPENKEEIIYLIDNASFEQWRPLLYVIPVTSRITAAMEHVKADLRASFGPEYIIKDLKRSEFDLLEF